MEIEKEVLYDTNKFNIILEIYVCKYVFIYVLNSFYTHGVGFILLKLPKVICIASMEILTLISHLHSLNC